MKLPLILLAVASAFVTMLPAQSLAQAAPCAGRACDRLVYFGTRGAGAGQGIFAGRFDERTGKLTGLGVAGEIERPTWLEAGPHGPAIYAVSEVGNDGKTQGSVLSFRADRATGKLTVISKVASGGGGPTYLAVDPRSHTLFVANFGTGQVSAIPVAMDSGLLPVASVQSDAGTGPRPRQAGPHAHAAAMDPSGRFVLVADLGADRIFVYRFDPATRALSPAEPASAVAAPGVGPRHLVFHPNGKFVFVVTEFTGEILSYRWDARAGLLQPLATVASQNPAFKEVNAGAEIATSADGKYLYVSNRGEDTIATFAVNAKTGAVKFVQRIASGGKSPRSFRISPNGRWLLVANQVSGSVSVFKRDPASGKLTATGESLAIPDVANVTFLIG